MPESVGRDFHVAGPALVRLGFGAHMRDSLLSFGSGDNNGPGNEVGVTADGMIVWELGLTLEDIRIHIRSHHQPIFVDDWGVEVPADLVTQLTEAYIFLNLIHYDPQVVQMAIAESQGGPPSNTITSAGVMAGTGVLMTGGKRSGASGNHFVELQILPQFEEVTVGKDGSVEGFGDRLSRIYRFPCAYLMDRTEIPIGATKLSVMTSWLARPGLRTSDTVNQELTSTGAVLYDHSLAAFV